MLVLVNVTQRPHSLVATFLMQIAHLVLHLFVARCILILLVLEQAAGGRSVTTLVAIASDRKLRFPVVQLTLWHLLTYKYTLLHEHLMLLLLQQSVKLLFALRRFLIIQPPILLLELARFLVLAHLEPEQPQCQLLRCDHSEAGLNEYDLVYVFQVVLFKLLLHHFTQHTLY